MNKIIMRLGVILIILTLSSCHSYKRVAYLQDMEERVAYEAVEQPEFRIQKHDELNIVVTCKNPELALPFNMIGGNVRLNAYGQMTSVLSEGAEALGYVVDQEGCIDFPILGKIHVEGLTLKQLKTKIQDEIIQKNYIKDPIVMIDFLNFQITVLGEVVHKGNFNIKTNRVNLFEAIAMAGDLTISADRKHVDVIRTEDGKRTVYSHDLRSKDVYQSPAFYLKQNDIVYVKPNKGIGDNFKENRTSFITLILSIITAASSVAYFISR